MTRPSRTEQGLFIQTESYPGTDSDLVELRDKLLDPATSLFNKNRGLHIVPNPNQQFNDDVATVLRDETTGMIVKRYEPSKKGFQNAMLQFQFMNTLADRLLAQGGQVRAVRHPAVIRRDSGETAAIIEPAPGISAADMDLSGTERRQLSQTVRDATTEALGNRVVAWLLVNDINRRANRMTNVFIDDQADEPVITLIDQPYEGSPLAPVALRWLNAKDTA